MESTASGSPSGSKAKTGASRGMVGEFLSLIGSLGRHVQALGALAGEEAREAAALYLRLAVMLFAALLFVTLGYILLLLTVAFLIAMLFQVAWVWILLGFTVLHLLVAFLCANHVRQHWSTPVFTATAGEIRRDFDALKARS